MENNRLDVNFTDDVQESLNYRKENIGNINDVKKPEDAEEDEKKAENTIKVVGEETADGLIITFIDNSKTLQNDLNNLHK